MAQSQTEIRSLLDAVGLQPKKRYGQHFLHDAHHAQAILGAAGIEPGDHVLEIGPGTGALSEDLLEAGARLVAVEVDADLEPILEQRLRPRYGKAVTLIYADVLNSKHEINPVIFKALRELGGGPFKLIANLPYNVACPVLVNLLTTREDMSQAVVMVQREVARRLTAGPGGKDYGAISVIAAATCHLQRIGLLSPGCFWPRPKVESAVVRLTRRKRPLTNDPGHLAGMLGGLFSKRRKQLGTILGRTRALPPGIDPEARPEQLSVQQLVALAHWV